MDLVDVSSGALADWPQDAVSVIPACLISAVSEQQSTFSPLCHVSPLRWSYRRHGCGVAAR